MLPWRPYHSGVLGPVSGADGGERSIMDRRGGHWSYRGVACQCACDRSFTLKLNTESEYDGANMDGVGGSCLLSDRCLWMLVSNGVSLRESRVL